MKSRGNSLAAIVWLATMAWSQHAPAEEAQRRPAPTLVVTIVVDQMRADYIDRFGDLFCSGGFNRLVEHGARWTQCRYQHVPTNTAPGHSIILSGIMPSRSGIISNDWYSKPLGRKVYCVEDSSVSGVGLPPNDPAGKMSPKNFRGSTLGDQLHAAAPESRTIGIAIKDRGAILLAGRHPAGAYWFEPGTGRWITSTYYCSELPAWVSDYNARRIPDIYLNAEWDRLLSQEAYARSGPDSAAGEGNLPGETSCTFPHRINDLATPQFSANPRWAGARRFDALLPTPFGNDLTIDLARAAVTAERLGQRGTTDLLALSFSSPDYCGHIFGPSSQEIQDMYLRLDMQLASFFRFLDRTVGAENVLIVLTADHGAAELPEEKLVPGAARIDPKDFLTDVKVRIGQRFGYDEGRENLLVAFSNDYFYLDLAAIARKGIDQELFERAVGGAAMVGCSVNAFYTRTTIEQRAVEGSGYIRAIRNGFCSDLSGDVAVVTAPHSFFGSGTTGTTHGTAYEYDSHVPLIFSSPALKPGVYGAPCSPNDIAPTIATLLGVNPPEGSEGHPLTGMTQAVGSITQK